MAEPVPARNWLDLVRRHERRLAALWLAGVVLLFLGMAVAPVRLRVLALLQRGANVYDARWDRRLAEGARLVETKRYDEAAEFLARLDAEYPARTSRQARDKEREYLLRLLAQSYEAGDHKSKAMATWQRLVAFDSLNYRNHFGYAQAAERLLSGWAMAVEARDGYARALQVFPTHLPSLRGYIAYYNDRSEWRDITAAYRTYLDAFLLDHVRIRIGDSTRLVPMLVDGRPHDLDIELPVPAGWQGDIVVSSPVYPIAIETVSVLPAVRIGEPGPRAPRLLPLDALTAQGMTKAGAGWVPVDSTGGLHLPLTTGADGVTRISVRLRAFKLLDAPLWAQVVKCYRNLLDWPGLADAEARTALFESPEAAEQAFVRLDWAQGGQYVPGAR